MGESRGAYIVLVGRTILKWTLKKWEWGGMEFNDLAQNRDR